jgi:hypothetical protein
MQKIREELGIKKPKIRKKRKPMTEEQRAAAIERLAKARAARGITGTKNVHPDVLKLPEDHPLSYAKVKEWLKYNQDLLKSIKHQKVSKESKERMQYQVVENYVKNLKVYIKDNVWLDHRYGKLMENTMDYVVVAPAGETRV